MSVPIVIQSKNAVLSFNKDGWYPFVCATDVSLQINADMLDVRTAQNGIWSNQAYQKLSYSISLGGVLQFDAVNWTAVDFVQNMMGFLSVKFLLSMTDDNGVIKSYQGYCNISSLATSYSPGKTVENSFTLPGTGELKFFDGLIPCDSVISIITVTGQTAADGIVHITYTYTGAPSQIKYRIDGKGNYIYANVGIQLDIPGLSIGSHYIDIIPVCLNGYEGEAATRQSFTITQSLTCSAVITDITITTTTAVPVFTGTPSQYKYSIDGGAFVVVGISFVVPLGGLSVGNHTIQMVPICSNGVEGTGFTKPFTVAVQPSQSMVSYNWVNFPYAGNFMDIYVNGSLTIHVTSTGNSGSFIAPTGATVRAVVKSPEPTGARSMNLKVDDTSTFTNLFNQSGTSPTTLEFIFTVNGDNYLVQGIISA
jgi:hypothetical protein